MQKWKLIQQLVFQYIRDNKLEPGAKLPSDKQLIEMAVEHYGQNFSLQPVITAMDDFARTGFVQRRAGAATTLLKGVGFIERKNEPGYSQRTKNEFHRALETKVIELSRRPARTDDRHFYEQTALAALSLKKSDSFIVIKRLRILEGKKRVIQRVYLNPAHFPDNFEISHDFETESLLKIYQQEGFSLISREQQFMARFADEEEQRIFSCAEEPVLTISQHLKALHTESCITETIEYLYSSYYNEPFIIHSNYRETDG